MKKLTKGTVVLFAFLLASIMLLSGCDTLFGEDTRDYLEGATQIDKVLTLKEGENISLNTVASDVFVGVSPDDKVHLTYYEYDGIKYSLEDDGRFSIQQSVEIDLTQIHKRIKDITMLVPKDLLLGEFSTSTASGDVNITDISANSVIIGGGSGSTTFIRLNANETIKIGTGSGSVKGSIVGSRSDFTVDIGSGSGVCYVQGGQGGSGKKQLSGGSGSGSINITFTE